MPLSLKLKHNKFLGDRQSPQPTLLKVCMHCATPSFLITCPMFHCTEPRCMTIIGKVLLLKGDVQRASEAFEAATSTRFFIHKYIIVITASFFPFPERVRLAYLHSTHIYPNNVHNNRVEECHGDDLAPEMAECYHLYGSTLLQLAKYV